jgi:hypothetical protein
MYKLKVEIANIIRVTLKYKLKVERLTTLHVQTESRNSQHNGYQLNTKMKVEWLNTASKSPQVLILKEEIS